MADIATIARPYAEATFKSALEHGKLGPVGDGLMLMAAVARDEQMRSVLADPRVSAETKKQLFLAVAGDRIDELLKNLLSVLVDNHRDTLIAEIAAQYDELKHEHERVVRARITSAQPLNDQQRSDIVSALERRYGKKVEAEIDVDPQLLGGARVQVGDQVIHASVRDALAQMAAALTR
ncbi:MAG: F0F1 ATP synthase subunit delta [Betaproteobacteria bacterium]